jgi:chain length determinant protein EpsF
MTFFQFLSVLRARWKACLAVYFGTVAVVLLLSLVLPKRYKAEASVVVDAKPDLISVAYYGSMVNPSVIATQVDILTSDRVVHRVIKDLKLDQNPQVRQQWKDETDGVGSFDEWLGTILQKSLDVKPSRESNVISITYKAPDPGFAAALANAFVDAYLETALELRVDPAKQYTGFFEKQSKEARDALERAQAKLSDYQRENGISSTDERFDVETSRLNEMAAQLVQLQGLSADSSSREKQAIGGNGDMLQEALNNGVIQGMKVDLARQQSKLEELSARYGANYPQIQETKASIADLKTRIDAETRRITSSMTVSNTINRSREGEIRAQLEAQKLKVARLKEQRDRATVLQRDVDNAQRVSESIAQRLNQSTMESQANQANVSVLSPASPPTEPSFPKPILNMIVSMFLGVLLAVGVALVRELRDRRVRSTSDIADALGLPVLGVLPRPVIRKKGGPLSLMAQRVISGRLPAPGGN